MDSQYRRAVLALSPHGFVNVPVRGNRTVLGKLQAGKLDAKGICDPTNSHKQLVKKIEWRSGPVVFSVEDSQEYVVHESFFLLESPELPFSLLSLRDHLDYSVQTELGKLFPKIKVMIGPHWCYIYEGRGIEESLQGSRMLLSSPLLGNALNTYSPDPILAIEVHDKFKVQLAEEVPLPIVWGHPVKSPMGAIDNIYDSFQDKWYVASLKSDFPGAMSLVDLALRENAEDEGYLLHHFEENTIKPVRVSVNEFILQIREVDGRFRSQRKFSRLNIAIG